MNYTTNKKLMPFMQVNETDIVNGFALQATGFAGTLVKVGVNDVTANQGIVNASVGAAFNRVTSPEWGVKATIVPTTSGDTAAVVLGLTTKNVLTVDENGQLLKYNKQKKLELNAVLPIEANPVARKGVFTLGVDAVQKAGVKPANAAGLPAVGALLVPSNTAAGVIDCVPFSAIGVSYRADQIIG